MNDATRGESGQASLRTMIGAFEPRLACLDSVDSFQKILWPGVPPDILKALIGATQYPLTPAVIFQQGARGFQAFVHQLAYADRKVVTEIVVFIRMGAQCPDVE